MHMTRWGIIYCAKEESLKTHKHWMKINNYLT